MAVRLKRFLAGREFRRRPLRALWKRIYWRLHWSLRPKSPFVLSFVDGLRIQLAHSSASYGIYLNGGFSDPGEAQLFLDYLQPGMVVFDCGAHIGEYALLCSQRVGERGRVHAFEPDPRAGAKLEANVTQNRLTNVVVHRAALGAQQGPVTFLMQRDATSSSVYPSGEAGEPRQILVPMTTLDDYAARAGIERADALKIDVEGAEAAVLRGARRILSEFQPGLIFVECHSDENEAWVTAALSAAGYSVEIRRDPLHRYPHLVARKFRGGAIPCH